MTLLVRLLGTSGVARLVKLSVKDRAVGREIAALLAMADATAVRLLAGAIATDDDAPTLAARRFPAMLVRGQLDRGLEDNHPDTASAVLDGPEDAVVVDLPRAGHFANLEQPETFDEILAEFLERHR